MSVLTPSGDAVLLLGICGVAFCIRWQLLFLRRIWNFPRWHLELHTAVPFEIANLQSEIIVCWIWIYGLIIQNCSLLSVAQIVEKYSMVWSGNKLLDVCGTLFSTGSMSIVLNWKMWNQPAIWCNYQISGCWCLIRSNGMERTFTAHIHWLFLPSCTLPVSSIFQGRNTMCYIHKQGREKSQEYSKLSHERYEWFTCDIIIW